MSYYFGFRPYVPVHRRRANAAKYAAKLAKQEKRTLAPIELAGRTIAESFWGKAWCENLESYSDFENRLPRGRTYVRNGSVIDLQIQRGKVKAIVSGSEVYQVAIDIKTLPAQAWSCIKKDCTRSIDSLIDLLQGRFDQGVMQRLTQREGGLFPRPGEIKMSCSCPDYAGMCKHVAAVLYGVGARLDKAPELLFVLRHVDHLELITQAVDADNLDQTLQGRTEDALAGSELGEIFGIELDVGDTGETAAGKVSSSGSNTKARPRATKKPDATSRKAKTVIHNDRAQSVRGPKASAAAKTKRKRTASASA